MSIRFVFWGIPDFLLVACDTFILLICVSPFVLCLSTFPDDVGVSLFILIVLSGTLTCVEVPWTADLLVKKLIRCRISHGRNGLLS